MLFSHTADWLKTTGNGGHITDSNGYDIEFTLNDGLTKLDHEILFYDGSAGTFMAWVRIPTLLYSVDTVIRVYYGNSQISTSQENISGVWDSSYQAVWHLEESGNGTSDEYIDSSGNANHGQGGAGAGGATPTRVSGRLSDYAQSFDGGDFISMGNTLSFGESESFTYSAWVRTTDDNAQMMGKADQTTWQGTWLYIEGGDFSFYMYDVDTNEINKISTVDITDDEWYYLVMTYNGNEDASGINLYVNGALAGVGSTVTDTIGSIESTDPFNLGAADDGGSDFFTGLMDECRVSDSVRSADWIATEYNNQNSPGTFYTLGPGLGVLSGTSTSTTSICTTTSTPPP